MNISDCISLINQSIGSGGVWDAKSIKNSNLNILLYALSITHSQLFNNIDYLNSQKDIYKVSISIADWERFVGIPDEYFSNNGSLQERIKQVILKLLGFKEITLPVLKNIVKELFNIDKIEIINQAQSIRFNKIRFGEFRFTSDQLARNTVIIRLPKKSNNLNTNIFNKMKFNKIVFKSNKYSFLESFIKAITPFQYRVIFSYVL